MISRRRSVLFELAHYASQFRCRERRAPLYRHGRANAFQMRQKGPRASKSDGIILIKGCTVRIVARQFLQHLKRRIMRGSRRYSKTLMHRSPIRDAALRHGGKEDSSDGPEPRIKPPQRTRQRPEKTREGK